ncbi:ABC transporter permease [Pedobacter glucosidilyticus]|uniref:ABC transporter permease n=1 Tax=Pedobacter glucosidilyticus TaxID=1122941 RepID=UPI0026F19503|nr:ABC transporter permease subunit [Pedobacter glucosidilyticus]
MKYSIKYFILLMLALVFTLPIAILFLLSFSQKWVFPKLLPEKLTLENWTVILGDGHVISNSFVISLSIALFVAGSATILGFVLSRYIAYHPKRRLLTFLTYFPFALSPVIFAICLKYYFIKLGLIGNLYGIVLAQLIIALPYSIIFFLSFWNQKVLDYQNLVYTLGGKQKQAFLYITLPLAKSFLVICFFQCFLISWFEYGLTSIIGYGKISTLTIHVFQFINEANIFYAALSCCLLILPPVILLWFNKRFIIQQKG